MSIWLFMRMSAVAEAGLAPSRSNRPNQRTKAGSFAREAAKKAARPPAPHDCWCGSVSRMKWKRAFELILSLAAVGGTSFLIALIARYDMSTTAATGRVGALSAAALVFVAIAGGALLNGVDPDYADGGRGAPRSARRRQLPSLQRRRGASRAR
jgi:hypothetical protein